MDQDIDKGDSVHARGIYTTLDSLLDTRASVLQTYWPGVIEPLLLSGDYHTRLVDAFGPVSFEEFKEKYDARTAEDLKFAVMTPVLPLLRDDVKSFQYELINQGFRSTPKVFINTWPYTFSEEWGNQFVEFITGAITMPGLVKVKLFCRHPREVDTLWVDRHVHVMYDYHGIEWMEYQTKNFKKRTIAHVHLNVPALDWTGQHTHETLKQIESDEGIHPIVDLENIASIGVGLKHLFIHNFSIINPKTTPVF